MFIRFFLFSLLFLSFLLPLSGEDQRKAFPYRRMILLPEKAEGKAVALELDKLFYEKGLLDGKNMRLLTQEGKIIPFLIRKEAWKEAVKKDMAEEGRITKMELLANGAISFVVEGEKGKEALFTGLSLTTSARDFARKISIYLLPKNGKEKLLYKGHFFDHSSRMDFRKNKWDWKNSSPGKGVRIVIENYASPEKGTVTKVVEGGSYSRKEFYLKKKEIPIKKVHLYKEGISYSIIRKERPLSIVKRKDSKSSTLVEFTSFSFPLSEMIFTSSTPHFARSFELFGVKEGGEEVFLTRGKLIRKEKKEIKIKLEGASFSSYKLMIINEDAPPLDNIGLSGSGPLQYLLFLPGKEKRIFLYYGKNARKELPAPRYDLEEALPFMFWKDLPKAQWQVLEKNPLFRERLFSPSFRLFFYGILSLGVLLGVLLLIKNWKKVLASTPEN